MMGEESVNKRNEDKDPQAESWYALYVVAEHWQSELQFFADELRFLLSLIDKYFVRLIEEDNIEKTRSLASKLVVLDKAESRLEQKIADHLKHLGNLIKTPFPYDAQRFRDEHGKMEVAMAELFKEFRIIKKGIFELTEQIMDSEKAKHLLGR